jgi:MFS family permease
MTADVADKPAASEGAAEIKPLQGAYRSYATGLLMAIYAINFLDRQVVNILAEPIKRDLKLADWQLGLMSGLAFALFYTIMGFPIARLADRQNRPRIIAISIAVWSVFTALCGMAQNFVQLVLIRVGVGVGEAGCSPAAHSLIMDYAPPEKRSSALALYGMGAPIGGLIGMAFGGVIADAYGWRTAFVVAGAPGLFFAVLAAFTLKEPRLTLARHAARAAAVSNTLSDTLRLLASKRSYRYLVSAMAIGTIVSYGYTPFLASFYLRNHPDRVAAAAKSLGQIFGFNLQSVGFLGIAIGLIAGLCGVLGIWAGGKIADRYAPADPRRYMYGSALGAALCAPTLIAATIAPSLSLSLILMGVLSVIAATWYGPAYAASYSVVPPNMRATAAALVLLITNLVGLGLGPLLVGVISDLFATRLGAAGGVRWSLAVISLCGFISAALFWRGAHTLREDMVRTPS